MCGRFTLTATKEKIIEHFAIKSSFVYKARYNIAPFQPVVVIRMPGKLEFLTWGLKSQFINVRAENITKRTKRCLIIADGYYHWKILGKRKQPYYVRQAGHGLFAFAGVYAEDTCAIITQDKAPVLVLREYYQKWLSNKFSEDIAKILSNNNDTLQAIPVAMIVNNPQNDNKECILPLHAV